jgi:predicted component of type VI protein secretion system
MIIEMNKLYNSILLKYYIKIKSINYSIYLREKLPDLDDSSVDGDNSFEQRINEIFDQKNFLEEINKKLE